MKSKNLFFRTSVFSAAALALAGWLSPAQAQDEGSDFGGVYVGGEVGYSRVDDNNVFVGNTGGVYYGGFFGVRGQSNGGFVYGVEGFAGSASNSTTVTVGNVVANLDIGRVLGVDGIIGFAASDRVLIFAHGGYINAKVTASTNTPPMAVSASEGGWRAGGGIEVKLKNNVHGRAKISYGDIENIDILSATGGILIIF